jgi:hypothetical protein
MLQPHGCSLLAGSLLADTPSGWLLLSGVTQSKVRATCYDPQREQLLTMSVDGCTRLWTPDLQLRDTVSGADWSGPASDCPAAQQQGASRRLQL